MHFIFLRSDINSRLNWLVRWLETHTRASTRNENGCNFSFPVRHLEAKRKLNLYSNLFYFFVLLKLDWIWCTLQRHKAIFSGNWNIKKTSNTLHLTCENEMEAPSDLYYYFFIECFSSSQASMFICLRFCFIVFFSSSFKSII